MVLDGREDLDRLAVGLVGRREVAAGVRGGGADTERVGLLAMVTQIGKPGLGALGQAQRVLGIALFEGDPRAQDIDDRADPYVAREGRTLAAAIDRFARRAHVPMLELDRGERLHDRELDRGVRNALEQSERTLVVSDRTVELAGVVERDRDTHVALRREAQLAGPRSDGECELVCGKRLHRTVESTVDSAEMDERSGAKARVRDLALLHDVARGLERLGAGGELTVLDVEDPAGVKQIGELRGVAVRVDQAHRLGEPFESLFPFPLSAVGRRKVPEERGALAALSLQALRSSGVVTHRGS